MRTAGISAGDGLLISRCCCWRRAPPVNPLFRRKELLFGESVRKVSPVADEDRNFPGKIRRPFGVSRVRLRYLRYSATREPLSSFGGSTLRSRASCGSVRPRSASPWFVPAATDGLGGHGDSATVGWPAATARGTLRAWFVPAATDGLGGHGDSAAVGWPAATVRGTLRA